LAARAPHGVPRAAAVQTPIGLGDRGLDAAADFSVGQAVHAIPSLPLR
jgi:hypothetical protein